MDTWFFLVDIESNGERNRGLYALKSRGMSHSNQIREYLLTGDGVSLVKAYIGVAGVLMGSARLAKETQERVDAQHQLEEVERGRRDIAGRRAVTERQIAELHAEMARQDAEAARLMVQDERREMVLGTDRAAMGASRGIHGNGEDKAQLPGQTPYEARPGA
jgi:circadian clock protein KaiC